MTPVTWILDDFIIERMIYGQRPLPDVIRSLGHNVIEIEREDDGTYSHIDNIDGPVVLYGSHEFTKKVNPDGRFQPGQLGVNLRTSATQYMSYLPLNWFLNREAKFMTWSMFKQSARELF